MHKKKRDGIFNYVSTSTTLFVFNSSSNFFSNSNFTNFDTSSPLNQSSEEEFIYFSKKKVEQSNKASA